MYLKLLLAISIAVCLLTTGDFALAQSVSVSVSPTGRGTVTMTFSDLPLNTDLEFHGCLTENSEITDRSLSCEGANLGSFIPMSTGNSRTLTRTGIITSSCPPGRYTLEVELRRVGGATLAKYTMSFTVAEGIDPNASLGGAFVRLGIIGLVFRKYDPELNIEIWGITPDSEGYFLLRVMQSQIDATQPQGLVASSPDGRVAIHVGAEPERNIIISMGPNPKGEVHHVILANDLNGAVISTINTEGGPPGLVTSSTSTSDAPPVVLSFAPPVVPQPTRADGSIIHIVRTGDTINTIAQAYGVNPQAIVERNRLTNGGRWIYPGQELVIRDATTTVVDDSSLPDLPKPVYKGDDE